MKSGGTFGDIRVYYTTSAIDILQQATADGSTVFSYFQLPVVGTPLPLAAYIGTSWNVKTQSDPFQVHVQVSLSLCRCSWRAPGPISMTKFQRRCIWEQEKHDTAVGYTGRLDDTSKHWVSFELFDCQAGHGSRDQYTCCLIGRLHELCTCVCVRASFIRLKEVVKYGMLNQSYEYFRKYWITAGNPYYVEQFE